MTNGIDLFGEEQHILLAHGQQYMQTLTNQDIIEDMFEKLDDKKKSASVTQPESSYQS